MATAASDLDPDDLELLRTGFAVDGPDDGSHLSVRFAVERGRTTGAVTAGDEETRSVTGRRVGAAFERLRGGRPGRDAT